jgi:hypothetical protein
VPSCVCATKCHAPSHTVADDVRDLPTLEPLEKERLPAISPTDERPPSYDGVPHSIIAK